MPDKELKSCPFCGTNARLETGGPKDDKWFSVHCVSCRCHKELFWDKEKCIKDWNTRHPAPLEVLEECAVGDWFMEHFNDVNKKYFMCDMAKLFCQHFAQPKRLSVEEIENILKEKHIMTQGQCDTDTFVVIPFKETAQAIYDAQGGQER